MPVIDGVSRKRNFRLVKSRGGLQLEFDDIYRILADSKSQDRIDILNTPNLPEVGVTTNGPAVCSGIDANSWEANPIYWDAVASFSSNVDEDSSGAGSQGQSWGDPTTWVPIAKLAFESYSDVRLTDAAGAAQVNSAGQPFETAIAQRRTIVRYDFDQFEPATTTDDEISERNETVNDAIFKGKAVKTLLLTVREATLGLFYGYSVWRVGYSLAYKKDTWQRKRLDIGNSYLSGGSLLPYEDSEGNRIVGPLDGSGGKQSAGTAPAILTFDEFATSTFSSFIRT